VGYLFGYSGQKQNFPITKFGKVSLITKEAWFLNSSSGRQEEAYLVELQNTPGLSGAPVMVYGLEIKLNPLRYRDLPPLVFGVVKGLRLAPTPGGAISQGVAAVEPGYRLKELIKSIAEQLRKDGKDVLLN
jgi:hypothetical protein